MAGFGEEPGRQGITGNFRGAVFCFMENIFPGRKDVKKKLSEMYFEGARDR
jgi:hypothetical protein